MTALEIAELWEKLELELTDSLRRNLARHKAQEAREGWQNGVPEHWEAWQAAKLRDVWRFRRENEALLGRYAPKINKETEKMLEEQYAEGGSDSFFRSSDARLQALMDEMQNNEARVGQASLRYMDDVYRRTILRTATALNAGGMTYQKAVDEATKDFLAQGINCVEYANGRCVNIASYAEMAMRTCATRAMLMGEARKREALGVDTVLVSQYGACSDTCLPWQGRVYIDDVFQDYSGPRGGSFGVSRNGKQYMFLSVAMKGGLFHPNCRHTISTWVEGISRKPEPMDIAEIERINKLEAVQRRMERAIRRAKRKASGLQDPAAKKEAKVQVRKLQADLREFVSNNGDVLRRDYWRERDDGVNRKEGLLARNGPEKDVEFSDQCDTISKNTDNGEKREVQKIADIDTDKYSPAASGGIRSSTVILTENQREHIVQRRGQAFFDKYGEFFKEIAEDPDYIFRDKAHPNTAIACKTISLDGKNVHLVIRLAVEGDDPGRENSIITALVENDKRYAQRIRNNLPLYKKQ